MKYSNGIIASLLLSGLIILLINNRTALSSSGAHSIARPSHSALPFAVVAPGETKRRTIVPTIPVDSVTVAIFEEALSSGPNVTRLENLKYWDKLNKLRYPQVRSLERVGFSYVPYGMSFVVTERAWIVSESAGHVWLLHNDLTLREWTDDTVSAHRNVGFGAVKDETGLDVAQRQFGLAIYAAQLGRTDQAIEHLRRGLERDTHLCKSMHDRLATDVFEKALQELEGGANHRQVSRMLGRVGRVFPDAPIKGRCVELTTAIDQMTRETRAAPNRNSALEDRIRYWVWKLRDQRGSQHFLGPFLTFEPRPDNPAGMLARIGFPAVPALIKKLDDMHLSRMVNHDAFHPEKSYVLRVCDVALQLLNHLSVDGYFHYDRDQKRVWELSRASPQRREDVINRARTWWRKAQTIPERPYLQDLLKGGEGSAKLDAARRLYELDGSASLPVIRILLTDPDEGVRDGAARLLKEFE